MKRKRLLAGSAACLGMMILILDGKTALQGARAGLELCIRTVIPSLFSFFFLSNLLTSALSGISLPLLKPLGKLLGMPEGAESILLSGLLGGYPAGAHSVASIYHSGQITKSDAERLLSFCSNAGPAFLFGMVAPMFSGRTASFLLWGIHIASAFLVALLFPSSGTGKLRRSETQGVSFTSAMHASLAAMASVCGWVMLFRVMLTFLEQWFFWLFPIQLQTVITGFLELSNGCCALSAISDPGLRLIVCSGMLAWGGLCVIFQTSSVIEGLSIKPYLKGKFLQTLFSVVLSAACVLHIWLPVSALLLILILFSQKTQKRGSNPAALGV